MTGLSEEQNKETEKKTEEVIAALQNMPLSQEFMPAAEAKIRTRGRAKSLYDIAMTIKEPTDRRGSEQLDIKGNFTQGSLIYFFVKVKMFLYTKREP